MLLLLFCDKRREEVSNVSLGQHFGKTSANISQEDVMAHDKEPKKRRDRQPMTTIQILFPVCHPDQFSLFDVGLGQNLVEDALSELLRKGTFYLSSATSLLSTVLLSQLTLLRFIEKGRSNDARHFLHLSHRPLKNTQL